ncbi:MAG TPA: GGDEF domain-containing protein [Lachnospiraceae bacterium]|nr:GGDEF domain-containing protein [Lachnospiraceae bacterium]
MRQFQFEYENDRAFVKEISKIKQWCSSRITSGIFFTIYTESVDKVKIADICRTIDEQLPDALYMGCSTCGNINGGQFTSSDTGIVCTVCEYPSTKIEMKQYKLNASLEKSVVEDVIAYTDKNDWIKAIQMFVTIRGMSMTGFCEDMSHIRKNIQIFGGGAFNPDINNDVACVFSKPGGYSEQAVAFLFLGGEDFYVESTHITGWKPLGRELIVTKAEGSILYELDNKPAYDTYYKYLKIKNDENFFNNTLEFPFFYEHNGINILRAPIASNSDGSLTMTSDIDENVKARLAYGDPNVILEDIHFICQRIHRFSPEIIQIFSCAARRTFWGNTEANKETSPFQTIAPTSGFYTSGEFLRTNGYLNQHNVTLVLASMREGQPIETSIDTLSTGSELTGKVSMISRLATFIDAATDELESVNKKLEQIAKLDGLTGIYNRKEIQKLIVSSMKRGTSVTLIMLDIDNFKSVNDTYGHLEGDNVIIGLSVILKHLTKSSTAVCGRWGGEEFMVMLEDCTRDRAVEIAENLREDFNNSEFKKAGKTTVSVGVTQAFKNEDPDSLFMRVDKALYKAKQTGKNKVVVL